MGGATTTRTGGVRWWLALTLPAFVLAMAMAVPVLDAAPAAAVGNGPELISASGGGQPGSSQSYLGGLALGPVREISADGRYVAFASEASDLVLGDTNHQPDIFVRDRVGGTTVRVSVASDGSQGSGDAFQPILSRTGRFVVFESDGTDLTGGTSGGIYLHDRDVDDSGVFDQVGNTSTELVSQTVPNCTPRGEDVTSDGRFVLLSRPCAQLPGVRSPSVFVLDRSTNVSEAVDVTPAGDVGSAATAADGIRLSDDGRYVLFHWSAPDVPLGWAFVRDRQLQTTSSVGLDSNGDVPSNDMYPTDMSNDGRRVLFATFNALAPDDTNSLYDLYLHDRDANSNGTFDEYSTAGGVTNERVSIGVGGVEADDHVQWGGMSDDGRFVVFSTRATNLVPGDANQCVIPGGGRFPDTIVNCDDVFVRDRVAGTTHRVSIAGDGTESNEMSTLPSISADGSTILFMSKASNIVVGDTNGGSDVFTVPSSYTPTTSDNDGVPDSVESGAPGGGDGNGDGIPDAQQANVTSLPEAVDGGYVTFVAPGGTLLEGVRAAAVPADVPPGFDFPVGLLSFSVEGVSTPDPIQVRLYLPQGVVASQFFKQINGSYVDFSDAQVSGSVVTLTLQDGGPFDTNPAPGVITDPLLVAKSPAAAPPVINGSSPASPGSGTHPLLFGTADPGSTVTLYVGSACGGPAVASGPAATFAAPGLVVTVSANSSTTFTATASNGGVPSPCSAPFTYVEDRPPTISGISSHSTPEDTPLLVPFSVGDPDPGHAAKVKIVSLTSSNQTLIPDSGLHAVDGTGSVRAVLVVGAPNANSAADGTATITVKVSDGTLGAQSSFVLSITAVNDTPVAQADAGITAEDTAVILPVLANDNPGPGEANQTLSVAALTAPANGTATLITSGPDTGRVRYLPKANYSGTDQFTYKVCDNGAPVRCTNQTVRVTITPVNDAPTISSISNKTTRRNTPVTVAFTVGDNDNPAASLTVSASSTNTTVVPDANLVFGGSGANRTLRITPAPGRTGTSTLTITVSDGLLTASRTFSLTVTT